MGKRPDAETCSGWTFAAVGSALPRAMCLSHLLAMFLCMLQFFWQSRKGAIRESWKKTVPRPRAQIKPMPKDELLLANKDDAEGADLDLKTLQEVHRNLKAALVKYPDDPELLWRLAQRCHQQFIKYRDELRNKKKAVAILREGVGYATTAVTTSPDNFGANKLYAITLGEVGEYDGVQSKVENAFVIKAHALKASELNPLDPTPHHILGSWCYHVANASWIELRIARAVFGKAPSRHMRRRRHTCYERTNSSNGQTT